MTPNEQEGLEVVRRALVRLRWSTNDDAHEVAMWGLARALMNYDPAREVPFKNFAWLCVKNELGQWLKTSQRRARWMWLAHSRDAADMAQWRDAEPREPNLALDAAIAELPLTQQQYIDAVWVRGETVVECARKMGKTHQAVSAGLRKARQVLQRKLGPRDDGLSPSERLDPEDAYQP